jgi:mono/diheme cytochrome c family protein
MKIVGRTAVLVAMSAIVLAGASFVLLAQPEGSGKRGLADSGQDDLIERGRYLVRITGCNDCHTEGYAEAGGEVPEEQWLKGSALGWRGPWGTTYGTNLRIYFAVI